MSVVVHADTPSRRIHGRASSTIPRCVIHSTIRYGRYEPMPNTPRIAWNVEDRPRHPVPVLRQQQHRVETAGLADSGRG